jgi:hypothetical protein
MEEALAIEVIGSWSMVVTICHRFPVCAEAGRWQ